MSNPHPHGRDSVLTRIEMAEADLRQAEALHLATASNASLIAAFMKVCSSLADMIRLAHERESDQP